MAIGFKRITVGIHDATDKIVEKIIVEGKANKGGTVSAEISGLSSEAVKVYASDRAYYVAQKGVGDAEVSLSVLDLTDEFIQKVLGYSVINNTGIIAVGNNTQAPYVTVLMESQGLDGEKLFFGMAKGKFTKDGYSLATSEGENVEPEGEELTGKFVGHEDGNVFYKLRGEKDLAQLTTVLFPPKG